MKRLAAQVTVLVLMTGTPALAAEAERRGDSVQVHRGALDRDPREVTALKALLGGGLSEFTHAVQSGSGTGAVQIATIDIKDIPAEPVTAEPEQTHRRTRLVFDRYEQVTVPVYRHEQVDAPEAR